MRIFSLAQRNLAAFWIAVWICRSARSWRRHINLCESDRSVPKCLWVNVFPSSFPSDNFRISFYSSGCWRFVRAILETTGGHIQVVVNGPGVEYTCFLSSLLLSQKLLSLAQFLSCLFHFPVQMWKTRASSALICLSTHARSKMTKSTSCPVILW